MARVQDIRRISSAEEMSPLKFHSNTAKFLSILSGCGYYALIVPYRIRAKHGQHFIHSYLPHKIFCAILHLAVILGCLQFSWITLSQRERTLSEDPISIFCLLRNLAPRLSQVLFLYVVWIKPKGLRYLYEESLRFVDTSKKSPLTWRQRFMVAGYVIYLVISACADISIKAIVTGNFKDHMNHAQQTVGLLPFPDTLPTLVIGSVFHVYMRLLGVIGFYGASMFACLLTGEIGKEVAAHLIKLERSSNVTLRDITLFYEAVRSLMNAVNEAVSNLMAAALVNMAVFFGFLVFAFLDGPSIGTRIFSAVVVIGGLHGLLQASRGHQLMNGAIRKFLFKHRDSSQVRYNLGNLITLENMINHEPLGLRAVNFPVTFGLQVTLMSTSLTYFLIMLQFMGKPSSCDMLERL